jgi:hypothetical protein
MRNGLEKRLSRLERRVAENRRGNYPAEQNLRN